MSVKRFMLAAVTSGMLLSSADAAVLEPIQSDMRDYEAIRTTATGALSTSNGIGGDNRIGNRQTTTMSSSILGFALPALAAGDVAAATLSITFEGESASLRAEAGDGNIDLYGLPFDPADVFTQDASRYYSGPSDATTGVTKLQDNIFTVAEYPAEGTTVNKVSVDISDYVNSLYAAGAVEGDFAVLRLSYDLDLNNSNNRFRVVTSGGDGSTVGTVDPPTGSPHTIAEGAPFLSITTVPEPGSMAVLGLGALGLIRRRRTA